LYARRDGRGESCALNFVQGTLILARSGADYLRSNIVEWIWIMLDSLRSLVRGRTRMGNALTKPFHFWSAAAGHCDHEREEAIGNESIGVLHREHRKRSANHKIGCGL
jgi:hypothetical protein